MARPIMKGKPTLYKGHRIEFIKMRDKYGEFWDYDIYAKIGGKWFKKTDGRSLDRRKRLAENVAKDYIDDPTKFEER